MADATAVATFTERLFPRPKLKWITRLTGDSGSYPMLTHTYPKSFDQLLFCPVSITFSELQSIKRKS